MSDGQTVERATPSIAQRFAEIVDEVRCTERARVAAILSHAQAAGRRTLAEHLAFSTDSTVEEAATLMAAPPRLGATCAEPRRSGSWPKAFEIRTRTRRPPTLTCTMLRMVWLLKDRLWSFWNKPSIVVMPGMMGAPPQVATQRLPPKNAASAWVVAVCADATPDISSTASRPAASSNGFSFRS